MFQQQDFNLSEESFNILLVSFSVSLLPCSNKKLQEVAGSENMSSALICVRILQSCCCVQCYISGHWAAGRQVWACLSNTTYWALSFLYRSYILIHYLTQLESKSFRGPVQGSVWISTRCLYLSQGCQSELHHCLVYSPVHKTDTGKCVCFLTFLSRLYVRQMSLWLYKIDVIYNIKYHFLDDMNVDFLPQLLVWQCKDQLASTWTFSS